MRARIFQPCTTLHGSGEQRPYKLLCSVEREMAACQGVRVLASAHQNVRREVFLGIGGLTRVSVACTPDRRDIETTMTR